MWRFAPFIPFLQDLTRFELVDDIVVIDNDPSKRPRHPTAFLDPKVRLLTRPENIYVNPAWNLGVMCTRPGNEKICILNDDLIFDLRAFYRADYLLNRFDTGVIGLAPGDHPEITKQPRLTDGIIDILPWNGEHLWGFGMLMFLNKRTWKPIPDSLKMFYGDNWIFDSNRNAGRTNYILTNCFHYTPYSVTSNDFRNQFESVEREIYPTLRP